MASWPGGGGGPALAPRRPGTECDRRDIPPDTGKPHKIANIALILPKNALAAAQKDPQNGQKSLGQGNDWRQFDNDYLPTPRRNLPAISEVQVEIV